MNKKRDIDCYNRKMIIMTNWYEHLVKSREKPQKENPNTKLYPKRKELLPLQYYLDRIKKPTKQ